MTTLHDALALLSPVAWDAVPRDDLAKYVSDSLLAGELIINSVPPSPDQETPFDEALPQHNVPNQAKSAKELHASTARSPTPHESYEELQQQWGKPIRSNTKDNPLRIALFKLAGRDRRGAWYARRSVHEGISFARFKAAMLREFPDSLLVEGAAGAGAKRGLAADRRIEKHDTPNGSCLAVYELSAQMPPPVSPREFLALIVSSDHALTDKSAAPTADGERYIPRNYMLVSRPTEHLDAPPRSNFVRGQYESVELIREIPLHVSKSGNGGDPELNPVEWIMVTRSDPGGGIPRFMVDRGTPGAMLSDASKFFDWACGVDENAPLDVKDDQKAPEQETDAGAIPSINVMDGGHQGDGTSDLAQQDTSTSTDETAESKSKPQSIMSSIATTLDAGIAAHAPTAVSSYLHDRLSSYSPDLDSDSDTSADSFLSAEDLRRLSTAQEYPDDGPAEITSTSSNVSVPEQGVDSKKLSRQEKELRKIAAKREKLEQEQTKRREAEEAKLRQSLEKEQSAQDKAREALERDKRKAEERHQKEMERLAAKQAREAAKVEAKRRKKDEASRLTLVARERDDLRTNVDILRRENNLLLSQVEQLQRENTALTGRLGRLGGAEALKSVHEELNSASRSPGRARASSHLSIKSFSPSSKST